MNTKRGLQLTGFFAANPMAKNSDFAWSEAACNNQLGSAPTTSNSFLTADEANLMSRFSLNSSLTLQSVIDSDATSSSTSSCSATNNSSNSLSVSPSIERDLRPIVKGRVQQQPQQQQVPLSARYSFNSSNTTSKHLLELQREIKEEEEEIFADINSLINGHSNLYSTFIEDDLGEDGAAQTIDDEPFNTISLDHSSDSKTIDQSYDFPHCNNNNINRDSQSQTVAFLRGVRDINNVVRSSHRNAEDTESLNEEKPTDQVLEAHQIDEQDGLEYKRLSTKRSNHFSIEKNHNHHHNDDEGDDAPEDDELLHDRAEQDQYADEQIFATCNQVGQQDLQSIIQQVTSNLPKPCVFFLEGNCRRSDCKYSHDLSNITCKYWIEGFCFKGEMCPFLHSFTTQSGSQDQASDDEMLGSLNKKPLNPTFVIESEADFPSLPLDAPAPMLNDDMFKGGNEPDVFTTTIKNQILNSNTAVVLKTVKKKRKKG